MSNVHIYEHSDDVSMNVTRLQHSKLFTVVYRMPTRHQEKCNEYPRVVINVTRLAYFSITEHMEVDRLCSKPNRYSEESIVRYITQG